MFVCLADNSAPKQVQSRRPPSPPCLCAALVILSSGASLDFRLSLYPVSTRFRLLRVPAARHLSERHCACAFDQSNPPLSSSPPLFRAYKSKGGVGDPVQRHRALATPHVHCAGDPVHLHCAGEPWVAHFLSYASVSLTVCLDPCTLRNVACRRLHRSMPRPRTEGRIPNPPSTYLKQEYLAHYRLLGM